MENLHKMHLMGADRMLYVAMKVDPAITWEKAQQVVGVVVGVSHCSCANCA